MSQTFGTSIGPSKNVLLQINCASAIIRKYSKLLKQSKSILSWQAFADIHAKATSSGQREMLD